MKFLSLRDGLAHDVSLDEAESFYDRHVRGRARIGSDITAMDDALTVTGTVVCLLRNQSGQLLDARMGPNLVTTEGLGWRVDRMQSLTGTPTLPDYQGIGTGTTAANIADTALQTEIGTRTQGTLSQPTATTDRLVTVFAAGNGTGAITETGRLTASSGGTLVARQVFSAINKGASDSLTITHDFTVS